MDTKIEKTLTGCFLHFFGKKPGQQMTEFSAEIKTAVSVDRAFWVSEFTRIGYTVLEA